MKTKLCRPVLVENKNIPNIGDIVKSKFGDVHILTKNDSKEYIKTVTKQQLILISLEDEKIEVGDNVIDSDLQTFWELFSPYKEYDIAVDKFYKIIATQDQLSPELIQQLVDEYNNGGMKDFEIEMEYFENDISDCIGMDGNTNGIPFNGFKIKLTNGFVTGFEKEPILYTEEEVYSLLYQFRTTNIDVKFGQTSENVVKEWFEENKKK